MQTIEQVIRDIQRELTPQFEQKLRNYLVQQDKEWLIEQVIRLTLDAHSLHEMDRKQVQERKAKQRAARIARVKQMQLDETKVEAFVATYRHFDRSKLIAEGYLVPSLPAKGAELLSDKERTGKGSALLEEAKDMLFALLFGDESTNTHLERSERELLTLVLPQFKAGAVDFMRATTELSAFGTWQDPDSVSNDVRATSTLIQVEYGDVPGERIGSAILVVLCLINNLEINEKLLYARMESVEQSTLIE